MRPFVKTLLFFVVAVALFFEKPLSAWEQTVNDAGQGLFWPGSCFHYTIHERGSDDIGFNDLERIVRTCFDTWEDVPCSYFYFIETEPSKVDSVGINLSHGNVNLLVWREDIGDWPTDENVVGWTTVQSDLNTGEILDVDIEFNGAWWDFGTLNEGAENSQIVDFANAITHEIGHTIGFSHVRDTESTMYESSDADETKKRSLSESDIEGLCTLYPVDQDPGVCEEPHCGLDLEGDSQSCDKEDSVDSTCACRPISAQASRRGSLIYLFLLWFNAV